MNTINNSKYRAKIDDQNKNTMKRTKRSRVLSCFILLSLISLSHPSLTSSSSKRCEEINIPMCKGIGYNATSLPNMFHHDSQEEAGLEVHQFWPLVEIQCSDDLRFFLCSMYTPICIEDYQKPLPACQSVCNRAKSGCAPIMSQYGFGWPDRMNCDELPKFGDQSNLCMDSKNGAEPTVSPYSERFNPSSSNAGSTSKSPAPKVKGPTIGGRALKPTTGSPIRNPVYGNKPSSDLSSHRGGSQTPPITRFTSVRNITTFTCPLQFKTPPAMDYILRIQGKDHFNCGAPCDGFPLPAKERQNLRMWIGIWSLTCVLSCLFTILTFMIDRHRFKYPERPIIFLSFCYMCIGLVYLVGYRLGDRVACNEPFPPAATTESSSIVQMVSTVTQGNKKETCTFVFMTLYFFTIASSIWWVILTFTWFLAAGLKWGHEAIESNSHYYHLAAWAIPAIMTNAVLAMGKIEGDVLSGVCFIGYWNHESNSLFVFIPVVICIAIGQIFLFAGFISLCKTRTVIKMDGRKTNKLDKLMARIVLFSLLYICPMVLLLVCHYYEKLHLDSWILSWQQDMCMKPEFDIPCPMVGPGDEPSRPFYSIFFLKYSMIVLAGITSGFWVWSEKTLTSWANFYRGLIRAICCIPPPREPVPCHEPQYFEGSLKSLNQSLVRGRAIDIISRNSSRLIEQPKYV